MIYQNFYNGLQQPRNLSLFPKPYNCIIVSTSQCDENLKIRVIYHHTRTLSIVGGNRIYIKFFELLSKKETGKDYFHMNVHVYYFKTLFSNENFLKVYFVIMMIT
jgi:hypothetical protein